MTFNQPDSHVEPTPQPAATEHRRRFIEAALDLLREREPAKISMGDIAHSAGVSRPLIYAYFDDRDAVLVAAFLEFFVRMQADVDDVLNRGLPADEALREIVAIYLAFARDNAAQYRHLLDGGLLLLPQIRAARREQLRRLAARLGGTSDALIAATVLVTILENAALTWLDEGGGELDAATDLVWTLAWNGMSRLASRG